MGMDIRVDLSAALADVRAKPQQVGRAVSRWLREGGDWTAGIMRKVIAAKVGATRVSTSSTGQTAGSVRVEVTGASATIGPQARTTKWGTFDPAFLDQGTRPHEIRPRFAKALAFASAGANVGSRGGKAVSVFRFGGKTRVSDLVYARSVHHPGTKPMHFIDETTRLVEVPLRERLQAILRQEVR